MLRFIVLAAAVGCLLITSTLRAAGPPNVVVILADDLGSGDLGCYNPESKTATPSLDQLAAAGVKCYDAHSPSSICSPTRYGLLTGRYAWRSRLKQGVLWGYSRALIEPDRPTIASLLQTKGYATACVGKWHLGFQAPDLDAPDLPPAHHVLAADHPHAVDYSQPLTPGPTTVGFDDFFGIPASLDMDPYLYVHNDRPLEMPTETITASAHRRQAGGGFWRAGPIAPSFSHEGVLPELSKRACAWIGEQTAEQPFFLYLPLSAPHTPWMPTEEFLGRSGAGHYGDFVMQVDLVVGEVLAALEQGGHTENTLIIVTSDNGSHWPVSDVKKWGHAANLHYRGQKADIWEGGHRVPLVAVWPGHIPAGTSSDETMCLTDLIATICAAVDVPLPENGGEDSFNMLPALSGEQADEPIRPSVVHHAIANTFAIRQGDWKLIPGNLGSGGFTAPRRTDPKPDGPQGQLYNLARDPSEQENVWEQHPEVVERLSAELERVREAGRSR